MALVKNDTKLSLDSTKIPAGATDPGGSNLSSSQPSYTNLAITTAKTGVEDASKSTTFDAIVADVESQVATRLTADDIGTVKTANYNTDIKNIKNNQIFPEDFYNDTAVSYITTVDVYINLS